MASNATIQDTKDHGAKALSSATSVNDNARALREQDQRHVLHPWTHFDSFREHGALVIDSGEGAMITDVNGNSYLDAVGGLWCTNIGLGRDEMAEAIADQVRKLAYSSTFVDMTNTPSAVLAGKIASLTPGDLNRVHFTTGGSTAVDSAYRMVQFYHACRGNPQKTHIIARKQSYHGSTFASISIGNKASDRVPEFQYIRDTIHHVSAPYQYRAPDGLTGADFLEFLLAEFRDKIAEIGPERIGGFFAEPVMGAGGVIVPPDGYFAGMAEICRQHDILFVADEVVTAWGRLGHWFASRDEFDVQPDIITTAKGLSSGYLPIGAMIYSDRIHDVISAADPDRWYASGYTYAGHPVCCAAALKNIEIMEREDIPGRVMETGAYFESQLQQLTDLPIVGDVRGRKMMMCIENVMDKTTKALFPDGIDVGKRIANVAEGLGLIVRPVGHLNIMSPPLTLTHDQVDFTVETLAKSITRVADDLTREGIELN